jgi:hypothetical protein
VWANNAASASSDDSAAKAGTKTVSADADGVIDNSNREKSTPEPPYSEYKSREFSRIGGV